MVNPRKIIREQKIQFNTSRDELNALYKAKQRAKYAKSEAEAALYPFDRAISGARNFYRMYYRRTVPRGYSSPPNEQKYISRCLMFLEDCIKQIEFADYDLGETGEIPSFIKYLKECETALNNAKGCSDKVGKLARKLINHMTKSGNLPKNLTAEQGHVLGTCKGFSTAITNTLINPINKKVDEIKSVRGDLLIIKEKVIALIRTFSNQRLLPQSIGKEQEKMIYDLITRLDKVRARIISLTSWTENYLVHHIEAFVQIMYRLILYENNMLKETNVLGRITRTVLRR